MSRLYQILNITYLIILLVLVRAFAPNIFYDPFIEYFKNDFLSGNFPKYDSTKLILSLSFRYALNAIISLRILYVLFKRKSQIVFASKFYGIAFILLITIYFFQLNAEFSNGYLLSFYIRRMLIHPIFLLVLIPAFYYQKKSKI